MRIQQPIAQTIPALTGIRALAALLVLSIHTHQNVPTNIVAYFPFINRGYLGVDFFFVLSGFIITHVYLASFNTLNGKVLRVFFWHRFIRLYPVHVAVLLFMIGMVCFSRAAGRPISAENFNSVDLIWQFTLVHAWGVTDVATWNVPSWSISAEWFAYLLFPFLAIFLNRISRARIAYLLSMFSLAVMAALFFLIGSGIDSWNGPPALLRVTGEFICGAALCRAISIEALSGQRRWSGDLLGAAAFAGFLVSASIGFSDYLLVGFLTLTIMGAAVADGFLKTLLASSVMVWLGEISYSVYMVHFPILIVLRRIYERLGYEGWNWPFQAIAFLVALTAVIAAAAALYYLVERPMRTRLRNRFGELAHRSSTGKSLA